MSFVFTLKLVDFPFNNNKNNKNYDFIILRPYIIINERKEFYKSNCIKY